MSLRDHYLELKSGKTRTLRDHYNELRQSPQASVPYEPSAEIRSLADSALSFVPQADATFAVGAGRQPERPVATIGPPDRGQYLQQRPSTLGERFGALLSGALQGVVGDQPSGESVFGQYAQSARRAAPEAAGVGEFLGGNVLAPALAYGLTGGAAPVKTYGQSLLRGAIAGGALESGQQAVRGEFDPLSIAENAALFGAGDVAVRGVGRFIQSLLPPVPSSRFPELREELNLREGQLRLNQQAQRGQIKQQLSDERGLKARAEYEAARRLEREDRFRQSPIAGKKLREQYADSRVPETHFLRASRTDQAPLLQPESFRPQRFPRLALPEPSQATVPRAEMRGYPVAGEGFTMSNPQRFSPKREVVGEVASYDRPFLKKIGNDPTVSTKVPLTTSSKSLVSPVSPKVVEPTATKSKPKLSDQTKTAGAVPRVPVSTQTPKSQPKANVPSAARPVAPAVGAPESKPASLPTQVEQAAKQASEKVQRIAQPKTFAEIKGKPLTHSEQLKAARSAQGMQQAIMRADTKKALADYEKTQAEVLSETMEMMDNGFPDILKLRDAIRKDVLLTQSFETDAGRRLNAVGIPKDNILKYVKEKGGSTPLSLTAFAVGYQGEDENGDPIYDAGLGTMGFLVAALAGTAAGNQGIRNYLKKAIAPKFGDQYKRGMSGHRLIQKYSFYQEIQKMAFKAYRSEAIKSGLDEDSATESAIIKVADLISGMDFGNVASVTKKYRQAFPATAEEMLTTYRYGNMLSGLSTQAINAFSGGLQGILRPIEFLPTGVIDVAASAMKPGRARQHWVSDAPAYLRGYFGGLPQGIDDAFSVLKGRLRVQKPDIDHLETGGSALKPFEMIGRGMEAFDALNRNLIRHGVFEQKMTRAMKSGKSADVDDLFSLAEKEAEHSLFRDKLDPSNESGQGGLLSGMDWLAAKISEGRQHENAAIRIPLKWTVPFLQTINQISKQGIERTPLGLGTLPGNRDKVGQLGKAATGALVSTYAMYLAMDNKITWGTPKDKKLRQEFYDAGLRPYSIKVGDKWYNYSRLGPYAYPFALTAAWKDAFENSPEKFTDETNEKFGKLIFSFGDFLGDQSYAQGIGDLYDVVTGRGGRSRADAFGDFTAGAVRQVIPLSGLQAWANRMIDDVYREPSSDWTPESIAQRIAAQTPYFSRMVPAYLKADSTAARRSMPIVNAFSPIPVAQSNQFLEKQYDRSLREKQQNKADQQTKDALFERAVAARMSGSMPPDLLREIAEHNKKYPKFRITGDGVRDAAARRAKK